MANAIRLTTHKPNVNCSICLDPFNEEQEQWMCGNVHGPHDPFHNHCLKTWVEIAPRCPFDENSLINPNSLLSRIEIAKLCLLNAGSAASLGVAAAGVVVLAFEASGGKYQAAGSALIGAGFAASFLAHFRDGINFVPWVEFFGHVGGMMAAPVVVWSKQGGPTLLRGEPPLLNGTIGVATSIFIGAVASGLFKRLGTTLEARGFDIPVGIYVGAATAALIGGDLATTMAVIPLVSGIFAAMTTMIRK